MLVTVVLIATSSISYRLGRESKRPPKPRPHQHSYSKWEKYNETQLVDPRSGIKWATKHRYKRTCTTCGLDDFEEQIIR